MHKSQTRRRMTEQRLARMWRVKGERALPYVRKEAGTRPCGASYAMLKEPDGYCSRRNRMSLTISLWLKKVLYFIALILFSST